MDNAVDGLAPERLSGREFELLIAKEAKLLLERGLADIRRSGVQAIRRSDGWQVIPSRPDFEGPTIWGSVEFDAKVVSGASMDLSAFRESPGKKNRRRQLRHLYVRSRFHVITALLIHWNRRELKTKMEPAETWAFPVSPDHQFWQQFEDGEVRSLSRKDCREYGSPVEWLANRRGTMLPNLIDAFRGLTK